MNDNNKDIVHLGHVIDYTMYANRHSLHTLTANRHALVHILHTMSANVQIRFTFLSLYCLSMTFVHGEACTTIQEHSHGCKGKTQCNDDMFSEFCN